MGARTDLLLDVNGDLPIDAVGLMPTGPADLQVQQDMFASFPGEWKQFIFNGIGVYRSLKVTGTKVQALKNRARQQLLADGYSVGRMNIYNKPDGTLVIQTNASR